MESPFTNDWFESQKAHYQRCVIEDNQTALKTLVPLLTSLGVGEEELRLWRITATMHVDNAPDFSISFNQNSHPMECNCPSCLDINSVPHNKDGQPLSSDEVSEIIQSTQGIK